MERTRFRKEEEEDHGIGPVSCLLAASGDWRPANRSPAFGIEEG